MKKYYWKNGFYISDVHKTIPTGAVEITEAKYKELLSGQAGGKIIVTNATTGMPELQDPPTPEITAKDYDDVMEAHLLKERSERGYTLREPSPFYDDSSNTRWKQDAADWKAHRDAVMEYGLEIQNKFIAGEPVPTLAEFKAALPKITWTINISEDQGE